MRAPLIATALFLTVTAFAMTGRTAGFDDSLLMALRVPDTPSWVGVVVRDVTALGGYSVLILASFAAGSVTLALKWHRETVLIAAVGLGGVILSNVLKVLFDRARPDAFGHLDHVASLSYPSAHAMMSTALWVTIAEVFGRRSGSRPVRMALISMAATVALLVGLSRVALSVHWPTDVLGGWAAGLAWALTVDRILFRNRVSPKQPDVPDD